MIIEIQIYVYLFLFLYLKVDKSSHLGNVQKFVWTLLQDVHPSEFHDSCLRRQLKLLRVQGLATLPENKYKEVIILINLKFRYFQEYLLFSITSLLRRYNIHTKNP